MESIFKPSSKSLLITLLFTSVMLLVNYTTGSDFLSFLVTVIYIAMVLFVKSDNLLPCLLYILSFHQILCYGNVRLIGFVIIVAIIRVALSSGKDSAKIILFFLFYFLLHSLVSSENSFKFATISSIVLIFFLYPASILYKDKNSKDSIIFFIVGFLVSSFFGFLRPSLPRLNEMAGDVDDVSPLIDTLRFSGIFYDSNFYAIGALMVLFVLLFRTISKTNQNFKNVILTLLFALLVFFLGATTFSKSFIISGLLLLGLFFVQGAKGAGIKTIIGGVFLAGIVAMFLSSEISALFDIYSYRFEDTTDMNSLTTNRTDIWKMYMEDMSNISISQFLIGHGVGPHRLPAAHNTYLEMFYNFGLFGFLSEIALVIASAKNVIKGRKLAKHSLFIIALVFMLFFNLSAYTFASTWTILIVLFICCRHDNVFAPKA